MISAIPTQYLPAIELLKENDLPVTDLSPLTRLFAYRHEHETQGIVGIEIYGSAALIRSFAVRKEARNKGYGKELIEFIEAYATEASVKELYLITTTANGYFGKMKYQLICRADVPDELKASTEFSTTCPASAFVMKKSLD